MALRASSTWSYYRSITVSDAAADYQIKLKIWDAGTAKDNTANGEIGMPSYTNTGGDFRDIAFGDTSDPSTATEFDYWIEETGTDTYDYAVVWVQLPSGASGTYTFYFYYENSSATDATNGDNTFIFFDDFDGTSIDTNKWYVYDGDGGSVSSSVLTLNCGDGGNDKIHSQTYFSPGVRYRSKTYHDDVRSEGFMEENLHSTNYGGDLAIYADNPVQERVDVEDEGGDNHLVNVAITDVAWNNYEIRWLSDEITILENGTKLDANMPYTTGIPDGTPTIPIYYYVYSGDANPLLKIDWVFVAKYASPEPTYSSYGSETGLGGTTYYQTATDTFTLSDSLAKKASLTFTETITGTDLRNALTGKSTTDSTNLTDTLVREVGKLLSDSTTLSDVLSRTATLTRAFADSLNITDTLEKLMGKPLTDAIDIKDSTTTTNSTVSTTSDDTSIRIPYQRNIFYSNGLWWCFYCDGADMVYRTSSDDGATWSSATTVAALPDGIGANFDITYDGTYIHYVRNTTAVQDGLAYRRGTPQSNGTISWSAAEQTVLDSTEDARDPNIVVDSNGYPWISYSDYDVAGPKDPTVITSSTNDGTWTTATGYPLVLKSAQGYFACLVPQTSGKLCAIIGKGKRQQEKPHYSPVPMTVHRGGVRKQFQPAQWKQPRIICFVHGTMATPCTWCFMRMMGRYGIFQDRRETGGRNHSCIHRGI